MALVIADRVKETSTSTGTGTINLAGAVASFQTFVAGVGSTNATYYTILDGNGTAWEVGYGTVTDGSPDTLSRTVLKSSNSDNLLDLSAGTHTVFATYPASKSVHLDTGGALSHSVTNSDLSGSIDLTSKVTGTLPVANGGTGATSLDSLIQLNQLTDVKFSGTNFTHSILIGNNGAGVAPTTGTLSGLCQGNLGIGFDTLKSLSTGDYNVAIGYNAGNSITSGYGNILFGSMNVGQDIDTGFQNIAIGGSSMKDATSGRDNIAIGISSLKGGSDTLTGDYNVALGTQALRDVTSGSKNVGIGYQAGQDITGTDSSLLFIANAKTASGGTLIKGDFSNKYVAVGKADVTFADAAFQIYPNGTDDVALYVKQIGSSSGDLILMENNTGTDQFVVSSSGAITTGSYTATAIDGAYIDIEGTEIKSTGVTGTDKYLRVDGDGTCSWQTVSTGSTLTQEQVEDYAGALVATGGTKTLITVTYDDANNNMDFVVDNDLSNYSNSSSGFLTAHPSISAASSSDNSGRTYIQDITLDSNGHVTGIATATETVTDTNTQLSQEQVEDYAGALVATGGTKTLITVTYDDGNGNMDFVVDNNLANYNNSSSGFLTAHPNISAASSSDNSGRTYIQDITLDSNGHVTGIVTAAETVTDTNTQLSTEEVQDIAGPLVATGGTKTLITVTYDDANGDMDFVVDNDLSNYNNSSSGFLTAHPNISAASSSDNSGRTYIQDITVDSNGHVTGIATATETVTDTDTTYTGGTNLTLAGTTFNVDDAFLINSGDDTTSGTITALGFKNTGQNAVEINPHGTSAGNTGEIRLLELAANGTNYVGFKAPDAIGGSDSQIYVLPAADGSNGYQLTTDGSGNLSWAAAGGGGGGEANENSFKTISVSGQDDVVADTTTDTLTLAAGSNVTITTTAGTDTVTIASADTNTQLSQEQVEDFVGGMLGGTETLITVTYQDGTGDIDFVVDNDLSNYDNSSSGFITATLTEEQVEDFVGGMLGGTETGITVTYQDGTGDIDFVVSDTTVAGDSGSTGITPGDTLTIAGGTNVTTAMSGDTLTITATDTNTTYSAATSSALGLVKIEDDTEQSVAANAVSATASRTYGIQLNSSDQAVVNVPWTDTDNNTTYTAGDGLDLGGTEFSVDLKANGGLVIESTEIAVDLGASSITGTLAVGDGGTGLTSIATLLNSNVTPASLSLVIGTNVQAYDADLAAIAGLTSAADKGIQFTGSGTAATYDLTAAGKALLDDADAAAQRTTLGVDAAGTDNSTAVTLVTSSHDYLSISTQAITLGAIDLAADVTGTLPVGNGGTGLTSIATLLNSNNNIFKTISVSGQDDVVADSATDTLTLAAGSNVTITTTAGTDTVTIAAATLTEEQVEDFVGGMLGGTETGITVTYQDGTHDIDFVVADTTVAGDSGSTGITPGDTLTIAGGTNVTTAMSGDTLTITATDTNTTYTKASFDIDHLFTLVGASADTDEHLGTFTGSTIADNQTIKAAIQAVETAVETKGATAGSSSIVTVGALDAGSITSGFGTIATGDTISGTTITASTALKTVLIEYTDGDDAITIHDGGSISMAKAVYHPIANAEAEPEDATVNIDLRKANYFDVELNANVTDIDFTYGKIGQRFMIRFEQDASSGPYTIAWNAVTMDFDGGGSPVAVTVSWPGGTAPTMTATDDKADTYGFIVRAEGHMDAFVIGQNISVADN